MSELSKSYIADSAKLGSGTVLGKFCVIEDDVIIDDGCQIGHHVIIHNGTHIGSGVRIDDNAVIGKEPMRAANSAVTKKTELEPARIGDNCILGTGIIIYRGCTIGEKVLVADHATVRENVTIGDFTIVGRGAAIENYCTIGKKCKLETNVYITAFSELEDFVLSPPCVATSNDNFVGRTQERFKHFKGVIAKKGARIGVNATILPGKTIAEDTLVAAGALVTKDTKAHKIVAGSPARAIKDVPKEQLLENQ